MKEKTALSAADERRRLEFRKRFNETLKKRPEISDEDFVAETEVSDEQYAIGFVLPYAGNEKGGKND
jgi:hypothetical protein